MTENKIYEPHTPAAGDRAHFALQLFRTAMLGFPHLCTKTACRRARWCSCDPDICMGRFGPLVPDDVRNGIDALARGHMDGLSYEQVRAREPWAVGAYEEWNEKIRESIRETEALAQPEMKKNGFRPLATVR